MVTRPEVVDGDFMIGLKSVKPSSIILKKLYQNWLTERAQYIFEQKENEYSKKIGVRVKRIAVKNLRIRWGSLSNNGIINFNLNLIKAPEDTIDYIIA